MSHVFTDQLNERMVLDDIPRRIVSLVPSQTEFLFDIGAGDQITGVTRFCVHPEEARRDKVIVGGTKNYNLERIRELKPDLIIGNKEENVKEFVEMLRREFPVWMSDVKTLEGALSMMQELGRITGHELPARRIVSDIRQAFNQFKKLPASRTLYFIWKNPYMVAGADTFIDHILNRIGLKNAASDLSRYPVLSVDQIKALHPDLILLSSEPYPFKEQDREELQRICPAARIIQVDGEIFTWYGSRLRKGPAYYSRLMEMIF